MKGRQKEVVSVWVVILIMLLSLLVAPRSRSLRMPQAEAATDADTGGMQYANWSFNQGNLKEVDVVINIDNNLTTNDGLFFQAYDGYINGNVFYFGLQTRVGRPGYGLTGKGLCFSEFGTTDISNMRVAPGGWYEAGTYEGPFISVRYAYSWTNHEYAMSVKYGESDSIGDWYEFWIEDLTSSSSAYAGALRFPFPQDLSKKGITDRGGTWTELYYREAQGSPLPEWRVSILHVSAVSNDGALTSPYAVHLRNADNFYHINQVFHPENNRLDFLIGGTATKSFGEKDMTLNTSTYTLTTTVSSGTGGLITRSPDAPSYTSGALVTLTAAPTIGYIFTGWSDDLSGYTNPTTITMMGNKTVTATFTAIPTYTLTPSAGSGGTISPNTPQTSLQGDKTVFTISPGSGYHIADVFVDGVSQGTISSYTFTNVTSNHTISARFEQEKKQTVIVLQIGKSAFTVNGIPNGSLDSPPVIKYGRTLVPIRAIIEALTGSVSWDGTARKATVKLESTTIVLWIGKSVATVNGASTLVDSTNAKVVPELMNGRTMLPLRFVTENLGATVDWNQSTQTITITYGAADPSAVTRISRTVTYAGKKYAFEIVRIDLQGKGISVVPVASPGGMDTGAPYTTFAIDKPLAMVNALPFDTTTHVMIGSLGGGGIYPQVKSGFSETIGVNVHGIPFYAEGRLDVTVDVTAQGQTTSMTTYSINSTSWGGFSVYTNWYPEALWVGSNEQLIVVDQGRIVERVCGATFQPKLMRPGQYAIHGYQAAVNHWTTDTITPLRNAETARLHIVLGERDLATGFFIQSAPVVLRAGQPIMGADEYPDSFRMTKTGARSFLGIGGGRYLYFIASPTPMSLRTDNVGGALAQLKLFSDVISLDGGGSTTLYCKGAYIYTPGRQLVTCLVVPQ